MNPTQALEILDKVSQIACMNRQDHLNSIQALQVVKAELEALAAMRAPSPKKEEPQK